MKIDILSDIIGFNVPDPERRSMKGTVETHKAGFRYTDRGHAVAFFDDTEYEASLADKAALEGLTQIVYRAEAQIKDARSAAARLALVHYHEARQ